jgi:hypothetical protein
MSPVEGAVILGSVKLALDRIDRILDKSSSASKVFSVSLSAYMEAARAAILGLLNGAEQILSEAATCNTKDSKQVQELSNLIESYLHENHLRPRLEIAIAGIRKCRDALHEQSGWKFPWIGNRREEVVSQLSELLNNLAEQLESLGGRILYGQASGYATAEISELKRAIAYLKDHPNDNILSNLVKNARTHIDYACIELVKQMTSLENQVKAAFR